MSDESTADRTMGATGLPLCRPRKAHKCRLCGQTIAVGELCERWTSLDPGEGWGTSHAHPECYRQTVVERWNEDDWESTWPGDMERPEKTAK